MDKEDFYKYLKKSFPIKSSFFSGVSLFVVDFFIILFCFCLSFSIVNLFVPTAINFRSFINYSVYLPFILLIFAAAGLYPGIMISPTEEIKKIFTACFFSYGGISFTIILTEILPLEYPSQHIIKDSEIWALCLAFLINLPISTILIPGLREATRHIFSAFKWWGVPAVIYCNGESAEPVISRLTKNKYLGYKPAVIIDSSKKVDTFKKGQIPILNPQSDLLSVLYEDKIKVAILCDYNDDVSFIMQKYRYTIVVLKNQMNFTNTNHLRDIAGIIGFSATNKLTFSFNRFIKRFFDIFFCLILMPFLIPIIFILSIGIKISSKGPVFYNRKRIGKNGKEFKCWKFRSMVTNADEILAKVLTDPERKAEYEKYKKLKDDPRVTPFGKFIRKYSLDELPQIINIFTGQMSFIGPRPYFKEELEENKNNNANLILSVTPGLSGLWQVSGRSETEFEERINLDTYYIQNWSIWLDIWILIKTVWVVFKHKGAY